MMQALGLIEVVGLAAGVEAADVACKSADVELVGYELAKGGGYVTVKVLGQVGAVKAAVDAATVAAGRMTRVVSALVIPRPAEGLAPLIENAQTVGYHPPAPKSDLAPEPVAAPADASAAEPATDAPAARPVARKTRASRAKGVSAATPEEQR